MINDVETIKIKCQKWFFQVTKIKIDYCAVAQ